MAFFSPLCRVYSRVLGQDYRPCPLTSIRERQWRRALRGQPNKIGKIVRHLYRIDDIYRHNGRAELIWLRKCFELPGRTHETYFDENEQIPLTIRQLPYPSQAEHSFEIGSSDSCQPADVSYLSFYQHGENNGTTMSACRHQDRHVLSDRNPAARARLSATSVVSIYWQSQGMCSSCVSRTASVRDNLSG